MFCCHFSLSLLLRLNLKFDFEILWRFRRFPRTSPVESSSIRRVVILFFNVWDILVVVLLRIVGFFLLNWFYFPNSSSALLLPAHGLALRAWSLHWADFYLSRLLLLVGYWMELEACFRKSWQLWASFWREARKQLIAVFRRNLIRDKFFVSCWLLLLNVALSSCCCDLLFCELFLSFLVLGRKHVGILVEICLSSLLSLVEESVPINGVSENRIASSKDTLFFVVVGLFFIQNSWVAAGKLSWILRLNFWFVFRFKSKSTSQLILGNLHFWACRRMILFLVDLILAWNFVLWNIEFVSVDIFVFFDRWRFLCYCLSAWFYHVSMFLLELVWNVNLVYV